METKAFLQVLRTLRRSPVLRQAPIFRMQVSRSESPFTILVATLLSARTQDTVTVPAVERLLAVAPTPERLAALDEDTIARLIYPVGFYRTKARHLKKLARVLIERHGGRVPDTLAELTRLPGVGRKTANLVLGEAFGKPAICVDTHVHRISNRLGIVRSKTPLETERQLMEKVPPAYWSDINFCLVALGQTVCGPRKPRCPVCPVRRWCERVGVAR
ncbi:MAG: endonuclease III [Acidobacteria bacterium]|nr:endonuclease III [Acidobacteriota bacterium]MDW7985285.1 endonuclease III [Acidobacteriota bacterium]